MRRQRFGVIFIFALLAMAQTAMAQSAAIQGVITDQSGAVVPAVEVTVTNIATNVKYKAQTNQDGFYSVPFLGPGTYHIEAVAPGFGVVTKENLKLDVQQTARVDFMLKVGRTVEVVEVSAAAALLESEQTTMGQVIGNKRIVEMPLNKRNYLELAQLSVGILPGSCEYCSSGTRPGRTEAGYVGMGMRGYQNNVLVDGVDNGSRASGGALGSEAQASKPSIDAIAEFKVLTNNFSAEYGYRMGPKVLVSTKSGSNSVHGSLFEFIRNEKLDATNFFANRSGSAKPTLRQNQFGGTIGGPIIRNKTFGFFSYQGTRIRIGRSTLTTVPSQLARQGDFSKERINLNRIFDPLTTVGSGKEAIRLPFPNNVIPKSRWDRVSSPLMDRYPLPNVEGREYAPHNYFRSRSDQDNNNQYDFRIDHNFSDNDRFFFRDSIRRQLRVRDSIMPVEAGGGGGNNVVLNANNLAASWTHVFSPTIYNEARFGFTHFPTRFDNIPLEPLNEKLGIKGAPGDQFGDGLNQGFSQFAISGYNSLGTGCCLPNINNMNNAQIVDNLLIQKGNHILKLGVDIRRLNIYREASRFRRGQFSFGGVFTAEQPLVGSSRAHTGNGLADMLLGWSSRTRQGNTNGERLIAPYYAAYIQDEWKISPRLTLTLGLRWELFQGPFFPQGYIKGRGGVNNFVTAFNGLQPGQEEFFNRPKDGSDCGCQQDWNNFAPRVGFAYRLNNKTVIRASAGIFYGAADVTYWDGVGWTNQTPDFTEVITPSNNIVPAAVVSDGFPRVQLPAETPVPNTRVNANMPKRLNQYSTQWYFDIQRELPGEIVWVLGYEGSKTSQLPYYMDINNPGPDPSIPARLRRLRPERDRVYLHTRGANANYNALVTRFEKRFSKGFTFLASYTWSHNIDNNTEFFDSGFSRVANWYNRTAERSSADLDMRHSFSASATWELPFGRDRAFGSGWNGTMDAVLGGWEIGSLITLRSGSPFEVTFPGDPQNSGTTNRGNRIGSGKLSNPTIDNWFDQSAFVVSAPGVYGNNGRNVLTGPDKRNIDFIAAKRFTMPWEGHYLQLRFESFNFTNTPKFGQPNGGMLRASTGTINVAGEPRRIQFGLKYIF